MERSEVGDVPTGIDCDAAPKVDYNTSSTIRDDGLHVPQRLASNQASVDDTLPTRLPIILPIFTEALSQWLAEGLESLDHSCAIILWCRDGATDWRTMSLYLQCESAKRDARELIYKLNEELVILFARKFSDEVKLIIPGPPTHSLNWLHRTYTGFLRETLASDRVIRELQNMYGDDEILSYILEYF